MRSLSHFTTRLQIARNRRAERRARLRFTAQRRAEFKDRLRSYDEAEGASSIALFVALVLFAIALIGFCIS